MPGKILIADPNKASGAALGEHLKRAGFIPVVVDAADRVLEVAWAESPALIILEAVFLEPTGFEICKALQADPATAHLPIIMLSEQADEIDRILGLELGAEDYVRKPCHPRELVLKVKKLCARCRISSIGTGRICLGDLGPRSRSLRSASPLRAGQPYGHRVQTALFDGGEDGPGPDPRALAEGRLGL